MISQVAILLLRRAPARAAPYLLSCFGAALNTETLNALTPWQQLSGLVNEKSLLDLAVERGTRTRWYQPAPTFNLFLSPSSSRSSSVMAPCSVCSWLNRWTKMGAVMRRPGTTIQETVIYFLIARRYYFSDNLPLTEVCLYLMKKMI